MKEEIKQGEKAVANTTDSKPVWRRIVIATDGNNIKLESAQVAGNLELMAILQSLIGHLAEKK